MFPLAWKGAGGGMEGAPDGRRETEKISHKVKERNAGEMIAAVWTNIKLSDNRRENENVRVETYVTVSVCGYKHTRGSFIMFIV